MVADTKAGRQHDAAAPVQAALAIELRGISKAFGSVQANKDISIQVAKGTILGAMSIGTCPLPGGPVSGSGSS